ncbi:MAG: DUF4917 family protein [Solirubrobacterales bacterium]|nr:DUF4917 family protein [Solirubrobacterales bacterium]
MATAVDGTLRNWADIQDQGWSALLLGNGFSINIATAFAYESLFTEATSDDFEGGLTAEDREIFNAFETTNFEAVLGNLRDAMTLADVLKLDARPYRTRYLSVQSALGAAVRRVHLTRDEIRDESLERIRDSLEKYDQIFTTSYDLLLYWTMAFGDDFAPFCDCFWSGGSTRFDLDDCEVFTDWIPVYYLHGALHLLVEGDGTTKKLTKDEKALLDQFGEPVSDDPDARPLIISEASAREKLAAIEGNDYLSHAYDTLKQSDGSIVVFGNSLSDQDQHLIDAINEGPERKVAVSMTPKKESVLREMQASIMNRLRTEKVEFFDSTTHPLGVPENAAKSRREALEASFDVRSLGT